VDRLAHVPSVEAADNLTRITGLGNARKTDEIRPSAGNRNGDPVSDCVLSASRGGRPGERRTRTRVIAADPAIRIGGAAQSCRKWPRNRRHRLRGARSNGVLHQAFGFAFQLKPRVLMSLAAGNRGDPLHEIKNALRLAIFLAQNGFNDFRCLGFGEPVLAESSRDPRPCGRRSAAVRP